MAEAHPAPATDARLAVPVAAEGEYRWGETGEVIDLYVEDGQLHGYITRRSERNDAGSAPMTFSFAAARTSGSTFSFTTRRIHGDWYAFEGSVVKVVSQRHRDEGDYLLRGKLTTHLGPSGPGDASAREQPVVRQVRLKQSAVSQPAE